MSSERIYLDYHATTPIDPRVVDAMLPYLREEFGNAGSKTHAFGLAALEAVERARGELAKLLGATPAEIVFTCGATESNNLAILGLAEAAVGGWRLGMESVGPRHRIVTQSTEHHAVLEPIEELERRGFETIVLEPDAEGIVSADAVEAVIDERTLLVSIMTANNEIGAIQPVGEIGARCRHVGAFFHTDAAQAIGKVPIDVEAQSIDLLSISAHKLCGPKGVGVLHVRRREHSPRLRPLWHGGGQERGLRPATLNVPGIVGLGEAARLARLELVSECARVAALRDRLLGLLRAGFPDLRLNGPTDGARRLAGNLNVSFPGADGSLLLAGLRDIAVSAGSACTAGANEPSHVLRAIGVPADVAQATIRFGLGRFTTAEEVEHVATRVLGSLAAARRR